MDTIQSVFERDSVRDSSRTKRRVRNEQTEIWDLLHAVPTSTSEMLYVNRDRKDY